MCMDAPAICRVAELRFTQLAGEFSSKIFIGKEKRSRSRVSTPIRRNPNSTAKLIFAIWL